MAAFVGRRREAGIERFQLKVGNEPRTDVARTRACVEAGGTSTVVVADANGGWDLAAARVAIHGLRDLECSSSSPAARPPTRRPRTAALPSRSSSTSP